MFAKPAAEAGTQRAGRYAPGAGTAGCAALPEAIGELPVATLADEIETPGDGPGPGAGHGGRQPGAVGAERAAARPGLRATSTSWSASTRT